MAPSKTLLDNASSTPEELPALTHGGESQDVGHNSVRSTTNYKIGREHIAFYLGYLEGIPLSKLCKLYLEAGRDARSAGTVIRELRSAFMVAAQRVRPALAKLIRIPVEALESNNKVISLTDFQKEIDPSGNFYSEKELLELYVTEYPPDRKVIRNERLRRRVIQAVRQLEPAVATKPSSYDLLSYWISPYVAERLSLATPPLLTFRDVLDQMSMKGPAWYKTTPWFGRERATKIERWMTSYGLLPEGGVQELYLPTTTVYNGIAAWERFVSPSDLSGENGSNRGSNNKLAAMNDMQAIDAWIFGKGKWQKHTKRSYRTHAERFLLWIVVEKQKAFSSATMEDCAEYRDFLNSLNPIDAAGNELPWNWRIPRDQWIGPRNVPRMSTAWRPFNGPLTTTSQALSMTILKTLCEFLVDTHYLDSNPFAGVSKNAIESKLKVGNALTETQWNIVLQACESLPRNESFYRLKLVLLMSYGTGLRLSELASAKVASSIETKGVVNTGLRLAPEGGGWELMILGKGQKTRTVPLTSFVMSVLIDYMVSRGLSNDPTCWLEGTPIIATLGNELQHTKHVRSALSASALYNLIVKHFEYTSKVALNKTDSGRIACATPHWLRHTCATHLLDKGARLKEVMNILGHASISTTSTYLSTEKRKLRTTAELLWQS